jgi:hypothetical protein
VTVAAPLLVEPAFKTHPPFTQTAGPEVAELCAMAGFEPDAEQQLGLDLIFAFDKAGKSAAFEFAVVCARQNLKTGLFLQAVLGWLFVADERLIVWSAHEFSTAKEGLRDLAALIENCPPLSRRLKAVRFANDDPSIELKSGQRVKFKARTKSGGRGLSGDKVVLDEAFALTPDHMGALLPTLSVRPDPQLLYGSSAGLFHSDVLRGIRDRGRVGSSARLAYIEWCAARKACVKDDCRHEVGTEGCQLDEVENWRAANPLLGRTRANGTGLTLEYVASERQALPPAEFARERLGWWDESGADEAFGPGRWDAAGLDETDYPGGLPLDGLAVAMSYDLQWGSIAAAGMSGDVAYVRPLFHGPASTSVLVDRCREIQQQHGTKLVVDEKGPAANLIEPLEEAQVRLVRANTGMVLDAYTAMLKGVQGLTVRHGRFPELDAAAGSAVARPVGDRHTWGRKQSDSDISPLEAVTLAVWAASRGKKPSVYADQGVRTV